MKAKLLIVSPAGRRWPRSLSSREGPHREGMCRHRQSSCYAHAMGLNYKNTLVLKEIVAISFIF